MDIKKYDVIFLSDDQLKLGNPHADSRPCIIIKISREEKLVRVIHTTRQYKENFNQFNLESYEGSLITLEQEISDVHIQAARSGTQDRVDWILTNKDKENINEYFKEYM